MKTFKYKLYNTKRNNDLHRTITLSGKARNTCVAIQKRMYSMFGKKASNGKMQAHLTKKKDRFAFEFARLEQLAVSGQIEWPEYDEKYQRMYWRHGFLKDIPSQALQQINERVENGYTAFFDAKKSKSKRRIAPPGFCSSRKYKSFTLKQAGWKYEESGYLEQNELVICGVKRKFHKSRPIEGKIQTVTIKRNSLGELFVCLSCLEPGEQIQSRFNKNIKRKSKKQKELEAREKFEKEVYRVATMTGKTARAIDFGLKDFLVFDNGVKIHSPQFLNRSIKRLKKESRRLSKCVRGSNNYGRQRLVVARLHEKVANQRLDWARQYSHQLCRSFVGRPGFIFIEDLNLAAMKKLWGRKVSDIAFGIFVQELTRIARRYDILVVKIPRFEKTTGVCVHSGLVKKLELKERQWFCESCNEIHDRDIMAAKCILEAGRGLVEDILVRLGSSEPSTGRAVA